MMFARCPAGDNRHNLNPGEEVLVGCGSTDITYDGFEMFDCGSCGIFFAPGELLIFPENLLDTDDEEV